MKRRLRPIGLLADPDELDRYLNQRQPQGLLDYPAVPVQLVHRLDKRTRRAIWSN